MKIPGVLIALAVYALSVVALTWPLAREATDHLPATVISCRYDTLLVGWALAYESRAIVPDPTAPGDGGIYHPTEHSLFYGEAGFGAMPLFMPVFLGTGNPTLALNLVFLGGLILTATALHWVAFRWTESHLAAFVAGATLLTTPWVLWWWVPSAPNYAILPYLPLVIFLTATPDARWRSVLAVLALVMLQGLGSVYLAAATLGPLAVLALGRLLRATTRRAGARLLAAVMVAGFGLVLVYSGYLLVRLDEPDIAHQTIWRLRTPIRLPGVLAGEGMPTGIPPAAALVILVGLASMGLRRGRLDMRERRGWTHAAFWTITSVLISLPARTSWNGVLLPLPQRLLMGSWIDGVVRERQRLAVAALVGLALLVGLSFREIVRRGESVLPRRVRTPGALLLATVSVAMMVRFGAHMPPDLIKGLPAREWHDPYPLFEPPGRDEALLAVLAGTRGPLLELPSPGTRGGVPSAPAQAAAMYRAIYHRHPVLNGYNGYYPAALGERMKLAWELPRPEAVAALRAQTGLEFVVVHLDDFENIPRESCRWVSRFTKKPEARMAWCVGPYAELGDRAWWLAAAEDHGRADLRLVARIGETLIFKVAAPVASRQQAHVPDRAALQCRAGAAAPV